MVVFSCPLLFVTTALVVSAVASSEIFIQSKSSVDQAFGLRPLDENGVGGQAVRILPITSTNPLPDPEKTIEELHMLQINTHSYLWSRWEDDGKAAAALAHIRHCAVEKQTINWREPHRRTFCATKVQERKRPDIPGGANANATTTTIPMATSEVELNLQPGTENCFFAGPCGTDSESRPVRLQRRNMKTCVTFGEDMFRDGRQPRADPLEAYTERSRPGENWFQENLVQGVSPFGKGIFPNEQIFFGGNDTGDIFPSYRLSRIMEGSCPENGPGVPSAVDLSVQARAGEEMGRFIQKTVREGVSKQPASRAEIVLTIVSAIIVLLLASPSKSLKFLLVSDEKEQLVFKDFQGKYFHLSAKWKKALYPFLYSASALVILLLQLLPVFLLLQNEIQARNQIDVAAFEVIGAGKDVSVPFMSPPDNYVELTTAIVTVVTRNTEHNVPVIAVATALLTVAAILCAAFDLSSVLRKTRVTPLVR